MQGGLPSQDVLSYTLRWCKGNRGFNTRQANNLTGKIIPVANALTCAMVQAILVCNAKLQDFMCQVNRICWIATLVIDDLKLADLLAGINDCLNKVFAIVAVKSCCADDEMTVAEHLYIFFAHQLR